MSRIANLMDVRVWIVVLAVAFLPLFTACTDMEDSSTTVSSDSNVEEDSTESGEEAGTTLPGYRLNDTAKYTDGTEVTFLAYGTYVDDGTRLCYVYVDVTAGEEDVYFTNSNTFFSDVDGYEIGELYSASPSWCPYKAESLVQEPIYAGRKAKGMILAKMPDYFKQDTIQLNLWDAKFNLVDPDLNPSSGMLSGLYQDSSGENFFSLSFLPSVDNNGVIANCRESGHGIQRDGTMTYSGGNQFQGFFPSKMEGYQYEIITYDVDKKSIHTENTPDDFVKFDYFLVQKDMSSTYHPNSSDIRENSLVTENDDLGVSDDDSAAQEELDRKIAEQMESVYEARQNMRDIWENIPGTYASSDGIYSMNLQLYDEMSGEAVGEVEIRDSEGMMISAEIYPNEEPFNYYFWWNNVQWVLLSDSYDWSEQYAFDLENEQIGYVTTLVK